jgi:hypothetical protein
VSRLPSARTMHAQSNVQMPESSSQERAESGIIRLRLRELAQLFNAMDPSPMLDRELDRNAEEFIVERARELPPNHELKLIIEVATLPSADCAAEAEGAVRHYYVGRAESKRREFRMLMRSGRASLMVGLLFLAVCLAISNLFLGPSPLAGLLRESFIIVGWVAMWRPLEIYLNDWWPLRAEWRVLRRLSRMAVRLVPPEGAGP